LRSCFDARLRARERGKGLGKKKGKGGKEIDPNILIGRREGETGEKKEKKKSASDHPSKHKGKKG